MKAPGNWWASAPFSRAWKSDRGGLLILRTSQADAAPDLTVQYVVHSPPTPNPHIAIPVGDVSGLLRAGGSALVLQRSLNIGGFGYDQTNRAQESL